MDSMLHENPVNEMAFVTRFSMWPNWHTEKPANFAYLEVGNFCLVTYRFVG